MTLDPAGHPRATAPARDARVMFLWAAGSAVLAGIFMLAHESLVAAVILNLTVLWTVVGLYRVATNRRTDRT